MAHALSALDYSRLPDTIGFKEELIQGKLVRSPMAKAAHTVVIENAQELIKCHILKRKIENARVVRESGWAFKSAEGFDNVPGPDLMVLTQSDYDASIRSGDWFQGRPLFVVEVISPSERKSRRLQKVGLYLEAGAGAVVEIDLTKRIVLVHRPEADSPELIRSGVITFPFAAQLDEIFARLP